MMFKCRYCGLEFEDKDRWDIFAHEKVCKLDMANPADCYVVNERVGINANVDITSETFSLR